MISLQFGENPETVASRPPLQNAPVILDSVIEDNHSVFYITVEQKVICQTDTYTTAVFLWFLFIYIFHLCYPHLSEICMFFQEFILGYRLQINVLLLT